MWKTKSVTYRFYFFVGNLPKFFNFLKNIIITVTKSYVVEFYFLEKLYDKKLSD